MDIPAPNELYTDQSRPIRELVESAQAGELVIPSLQRPFVWEPEQIARFWDSLLRGWPFGSLLLWERPAAADDTAADDTDFPCRPFTRTFVQTTKDEYSIPTAEYPVQKEECAASAALARGTLSRVLDGQQRIQSLLLGFDSDATLTLPSSEWTEKSTKLPTAEKDTDTRRLYVDTTDSQWTDNDDETPRVLWLNPKDVESGRHRALADLLKDKTACAATTPLSRALARVLQTKAFLVLINKATAHEVVSIFDRLNTAGTVLTKEQVHAAVLCQRWPTAKKAIEGLEQELRTDATKSNPQYRLPLTYDQIVAGFDTSLQCLHEPKPSASMATIYQKEIDLSDAFNVYADSLKAVAGALRAQGVVYGGLYSSLHSLWLLVALHFGSKKKWGQPFSNAEWNADVLPALTGQAGIRWILLSQWAKVWASSSGGTVNAYKNAAHAMLHKGQYSALATSLENHAQTFAAKAITNIGNLAESPAIARASVNRFHSLLWAWQRLDQQRLNQTASLSESFDSEWSVDHAIPVKILETNLAIESRYINSLGNCLLIPHELNISKSDSTWGQTVENAEASLSYLISTPDLITGAQADYVQKVTARATIICDAIKVYISQATCGVYLKTIGAIESIVRKDIPDGDDFFKWLTEDRDGKIYPKRTAQSYLSNARTEYRNRQLTKESLDTADFNTGLTGWKRYGEFRKVRRDYPNKYQDDALQVATVNERQAKNAVTTQTYSRNNQCAKAIQHIISTYEKDQDIKTIEDIKNRLNRLVAENDFGARFLVGDKAGYDNHSFNFRGGALKISTKSSWQCSQWEKFCAAMRRHFNYRIATDQTKN